MTLLPGEPPETEKTESLVSRIERAPYPLKNILPLFVLKFMDPKIVDQIGERYPRKIDQIKSVFAITRFLFPNDKTGKFTAMKPSLNKNTVNEAAQNQALANQIDKSLWDHINTISDTIRDSGLFHQIIKSIKTSLTKKTVNIVRNLTDQSKKYPELFWNIFRKDKEHSSKQDSSRHRSITDLLGVFENITQYNSENKEIGPQLNTLLHSQKMVALGTFLYLQDTSIHGGYFNGCLEQTGLNPKRIHEAAAQALHVIQSSDWHNLTPNNPDLANSMNDMLKDGNIVGKLQTKVHGTHDPNIQLNYDPTTEKSKFTTNPFKYDGTENPLFQIPLRFFNQDFTQYVDISTGEYLDLSRDQLQAFHAGKTEHSWKPVSDIEEGKSSDPWPIFAVSVVDNLNIPTGLSRFRASQGKNMLHFDLRYSPEKIWAHYDASHTVIDGLRVKDYYNFIGDLLGANSQGEETLTTHHYALEKKTNNHVLTALEYTNYLDLSDVVVGQTYDNERLNTLLDAVNAKYDRGLSQYLEDTITSAINTDQVPLILQKLLDEYPEYREKYQSELPLPTQTPNPENELENIIYHFRLAIDQPETLLQQKVVESIRDLFAPKISAIHLFDLDLRRLGGVLNCVEGISPHQRLQLATVGSSPIALEAVDQYLNNPDYRLSQTDYDAILDRLSDNLLEQSLAKLGCGTPSFLAISTQEYKESTSTAATTIGQNNLVEMTNKTLIQSSTTGKGSLLWFITAGSRFNRSQSLAVGNCIRQDGKTGAITFRADMSNGYLLKALSVIPTIPINLPPEPTIIHKAIKTRIEASTKSYPEYNLLTFIFKELLPIRAQYLEDPDFLAIFDAATKQYLTDLLHYELRNTLNRSFVLAELLASGPTNS